MNRDMVLLPRALKFGLLGMTLGALLGEIVDKEARAVTLGILLGLMLSVLQMDASRSTGMR